MSENQMLHLILSKLQGIETSIFEMNGHLKNIDMRLDRVEARLDQVETRLDRVEARLDQVEIRLDRVEARLDQVEIRLDRVEARLDQVETRLDRVEARLDQLEEISHKNYALTEEFYVAQKEANTEIKSKIHIINGTLDMHTTQISLNTAALKEYKIS